MEKELTTNEVKHVKYEESKTYQIYDTVKYNGYKWIVINVKDNKLTLMMKNCLSKEKMKEIFSEKYIDEYGDIKYNLEARCIGWNKTEIRRGLNNKFLKEFNKEELVKMTTDYAFDYIRIPKIREIEGLDPDKIAPDKSCWMISPLDFVKQWGNAYAWLHNSTGSLFTWWNVIYNLGVRPVITIKSDLVASFS